MELLQSSQILKMLLSSNQTDFDRILSIVEKELNSNNFPQSIELKSILIRVLEKMDEKLSFNKVVELLLIFIENKNSDYNLSLLEYEFNKGISILKSHNKIEEVLHLYERLLTKKLKKNYDFTLLDEIMNICYNSQNLFSISTVEKCVYLLKSLYLNKYDITQKFWKTNIEGLINLHNFNLANELIMIYPYKNSDTLLPNLIKSYVESNQSLLIFELIKNKYDAVNFDYQSLTSCYNIILEEISLKFKNISQKDFEIIFQYFMNNSIKIKESIIENFLIQIASHYQHNFAYIERNLIFANSLLTEKIIEKIICYFSNVNDFFSIFMIIKLCKSKKISVDLENLNLKCEIWKNLLSFVMYNTNIKLNEPNLETKPKDEKIKQIENENDSLENVQDFEIIDNKDTKKPPEKFESDKSLLSLSMKIVESETEDYAIY